MRPPISAHIDSAEGPQTPRDSIAMGEKIKSPDAASSAYFICFWASAVPAADPAASDDWLTCDRARVSGQVKSHSK